jgi:hypothetical protein
MDGARVRTPIAQKKAAAKPAGPQHILRTVFAHPQAVKALGSLDDKRLRSMLRGSGGSAAKASAVLRAFRRVAVMLESPSSARVLHVAEAQALYAREHLVAHKEVLPSAEVTAALHVTRQALSKAVLANRVFSLDVGGVQYYPAFFADSSLDRRKLERVCKTLGDLPGWEKWRFFTAPKSSLGKRTPIEALKAGMYREVQRAAAGFAER